MALPTASNFAGPELGAASAAATAANPIAGVGSALGLGLAQGLGNLLSPSDAGLNLARGSFGPVTNAPQGSNLSGLVTVIGGTPRTVTPALASIGRPDRTTGTALLVIGGVATGFLLTKAFRRG